MIEMIEIFGQPVKVEGLPINRSLDALNALGWYDSKITQNDLLKFALSSKEVMMYVTINGDEIVLNKVKK